MGNSEQRKQKMSILICGNKGVGKHYIAENLLSNFKVISNEEYKGYEKLENEEEIECTLYIKSDLIDRKRKQNKRTYYSRKFKKINAAVFVFDSSNKNSLMNQIIKDFEDSRNGFTVAIIENKYNEKMDINDDKIEIDDINENPYGLDWYKFPIISEKDEEDEIKKKKDEIEKIKKGIFKKVCCNMTGQSTNIQCC